MVATILRWGGILLMLLGVADIIAATAKSGADIGTLAFVINLVIFIVPGAILYGIGARVRKRGGPRCPLCREPIDAAATVCPHCRRETVASSENVTRRSAV